MGEKNGFTLAEVLITLGIIGVVAALTMPSLIQNHRKHVVETRLQKFYSTINQVIKLSEIDNGPASGWESIQQEKILDNDGNATYENVAINTLDWYNKYLGKYLNTIKVEETNDYEGSIAIYLTDGSLLFGGVTWKFFPNAKDFGLSEKNGKTSIDRNLSGKTYFTFERKNNCRNGQFTPFGVCNPIYSSETHPSGFKNQSDIGCKETVTNERALCTIMIERNGWKIPKDYPIKF